MKRRLGRRALAAAMAASMVLSVSTQLVSAKGALDQNAAASEVSDVSSTAVSSGVQSTMPTSVVAQSAPLTKVTVPNGLRGTGTQDNPYQIGSLDDLLLMNTYINYESSGNKYFALTADIDLSHAAFLPLDSADYEKKSDFKSVEGIYSMISVVPGLSGNSNVWFNLNGNGHTLYNMHISVPQDVQAAGLFGYVGARSVIENLTIKDCSMTVSNDGSGAYALLAAQNCGTIRNVTVSDCTVDARPAKPDYKYDYVQLECGRVYKGVSLVAADNVGTIADVTVQSSDRDHGIFVRGAVQNIGVIAGYNRKSITGAAVSGVRLLCFGTDAPANTLSGEGKVAVNVGGIAGVNDSDATKNVAAISDCTVQLSAGSIMYGDVAGGIAGLNVGSITASTVTGEPGESVMSGCGRFGGIAGQNKGAITSSGVYDLSFAFSGSADRKQAFGGIAAENDGKISACVASGSVRVASHALAAVGGIAGTVSAGSVLSDNYAFVNVSDPSSACGAIAGGKSDASAVEGGNYWIRSAYGLESAVPANSVTSGALQIDSSVLNIPAGEKGLTFTADNLRHKWGSKAKVSVYFDRNVTVDNAQIKVAQTSKSFTLSSDTAQAQGMVSYSACVTFPTDVGTKKTLDVTISYPVFVTAVAENGAGSSVSNPLVISSYDQFRYIASAPNAHYRLDADITVGKDWTPVAFSGTLDGAGHTLSVSGPLFTAVNGSRNADLNASDWKNSVSNLSAGLISNLTVDAQGAVNGSLFGTLNNATLERITYLASGDAGFAVLSAEKSGALADAVTGNAYLHNCYVSLPITVTAAASGGIAALVGNVTADAFVMDNCGSSSMIAIDGRNLSKVGGLVGCVDAVRRGTISNCYASGSVYTKPETDSVKAKVMIGAIAADAQPSLKIENCYYSIAEASVANASVAKTAAPVRSSEISSLSEQTEKITVETDGTQETQLTFSLPQNLDACKDAQSGDISVVFESDAVELTTDAEVSGTDVSIGVTADGDPDDVENTTVTLTHEPTGLKMTDVFLPAPSASLTTTTFEGDTFYQITSLADLAYVADNWATMRSANLLLVGTIGNAANFDTMSPLGSASAPFTGKLIGQTSSAKICGLSITGTSEGTGLFAYSDGATFRDFTLESINVDSDYAGTAVLVGRADYNTANVTSFSGITIVNCEVDSGFEGDEPYDTSSITSVTYTNMGGNSDPTNGIQGTLNSQMDTNTAQAGTLAGSLGTKGTTPYTITGIIVHDSVVTADADYAYGVGGLIGYAYCNSTYASSAANASYSTTKIGGAASTNVTYEGLTASIIMYNNTVHGYGSVGGVLGMAGHFPENSNSLLRYQYRRAQISSTYPRNTAISTHMGALDIQNVIVAGDVNGANPSVVTAGYSSGVGGPAGGVLGSEMAGYPHLSLAPYVSISSAKVYNTTVEANATSSDDNDYSPACGGVAGYSSGTFADCIVQDSTIRSYSAGGILGRPSRKNYYYEFGNNAILTDCTVVSAGDKPMLVANLSTTASISGGSVSVTTSTTKTALHLGGLVGAAINAHLTVTGGGVGQDVQIAGGAAYAGGFVGFLYSDDPGAQISTTGTGGFQRTNPDTGANLTGTGNSRGRTYYKYAFLIKLQRAVCAADITVEGVSSSAVGGAIGYAYILPTALTVQNNALDGNYTNTLGFCAGVIGQYASSNPEESTTSGVMNVYNPSNATVFVVANVIAAKLNPGVTSAQYDTCYLIAGLDNSYWIPGAILEQICYDNLFSAYGQTDDWEVMGLYNGVTVISDQGGNTLAGTYAEIDMPNDMYSNSTDGTSAHPLFTINGQLSDTGSTTMDNITAYYDGTVLDNAAWSSSDTSVFTVTGVNNSGTYPVVSVQGVSSGDAACIIGALSIMNQSTGAALKYPGTNNDAKIRIHVPILCTNLTASVTWTTTTIDNATFYLIPDYLHLDAVRNQPMSNNYLVTADINVAASTSSFVPIPGTYTGTFMCQAKSGPDTGYYTISNLTYNDSAASAGLFAAAGSNATFKNVSLSGFSVTTSGASAGALVGTANGATFDNIIITNSTVTAASNAGAVAGTSNTTTGATGLTLTGNAVTGNTSAGGAFGTFSGTIAATSPNVITNGSVTGAGAVGGAVGTVDAWASVNNVQVIGTTVSSTATNQNSIAGGIVGRHIADSSATPTVRTLTVSGCKSTASLSALQAVGGIVGYSESVVPLTITNSNVGGTFTDSSSNHNTANIGGVLGEAGTTTSSQFITNTVFYGTLTSGHGSRVGLAVGACANGQSASPSDYFYYSSYQVGTHNLVGSNSALTSNTCFNLHTEFGYKMTPTSNSSIDCVGVASYTLDDSKFVYGSMTKAGGGTYASFALLNNVAFVLDTVRPAAGNSTLFSYSGGTFSVGQDGLGTAEFVFTNGIVTDIPLRVSAIAGTGTPTDPYVITAVSQFVYLIDPNYQDKNFVLGDDLNLAEWSTNTSAAQAGWASDAWAGATSASSNSGRNILNFTGTLSGTYQGVRHTLSNFDVTNSTYDNVGFFPQFNGTLKDVTFSGCEVTSSRTGASVGVAVGKLCGEAAYDDPEHPNTPTSIRRSTISGITVENSTVQCTSETFGQDHVGALVGFSMGVVSGASNNKNTVRNTTVSARHCAGGAVGGGAHVSYVDVLGCTVHADEYAGGVVGGTLSYSYYEYDENSGANVLVQMDIPELQECVISDRDNHSNISYCTVSSATVGGVTQNTSVYSNAVNKVSCVGGILGISESGIAGKARFVDMPNCKVEAGTSVTADVATNASTGAVSPAGQYNFAGGIVGYLGNHHNGFFIDNSEFYGTVIARGDDGDTSAGGLFGSSEDAGSYHFRAAPTDDLTIHFNRNVINGTINSSGYAGGIAGYFDTDATGADFRVQSTDEFMCYNIIAPKLVNPESSTHFGVWMGTFLGAGSSITDIFAEASGTDRTVMNATVKENYYSSYVVGKGMKICSNDSFITAIAGLYDVATFTYLEGSTQKSNASLYVKNFTVTDNVVSQTFSDTYVTFVDGTLPANTYLIPVQFKFIGASGQVDLSLSGSSFQIGAGSSAYATRTLAFSGDSFTVNNGGGYYSASYFTVSDNGTHHGVYFTIASGAENCQTKPYFEADLGCGLIVGISVTGATGDGSPENPYRIPSAAVFFDYFFSADRESDYLTKYYLQTADINFADVLTEISDTTGSHAFAPIGTDAAPFYGGYECGDTHGDDKGYRMYNFTYTNTATENAGLFGVVRDPGLVADALQAGAPRLEGIHLEIASGGVSGGTNTGGLVGLFEDATHSVKNCSVVTWVDTTNGTSANATVTANRGNVASSPAYAGGLIGKCGTLTLDGCFTSVDVRCGPGATTSASTYYGGPGTYHSALAAGGMVGCADGENLTSPVLTFSRCFTSADVVGTYNVGGLVGKLYDEDVAVNDCVTTASVTSLYHMAQYDSDMTYPQLDQPVSLVVGYRWTHSSNAFQSIFGSYIATPYVEAHNLIVAGMNTTEYARYSYNSTKYTYPSLFGMFPAATTSDNVYYDTRTVGRISVPSGLDTNYAMMRADGTVHNYSNSDTVLTPNYFVPNGRTTSDLLTLNVSTFNNSVAWVAGQQDTSLYPVLNMYDDYAKVYAKMSSLPAFVDPREADDVDTERMYRGLTYPVSIDDTIAGTPLSISASTFSIANDGTYNADYDLSIKGGYSGSAYTANNSKAYDLLFKHPYSQYMVLRNSYLNFGTATTVNGQVYENVLRDEKAPYVNLQAAMTSGSRTWNVLRCIRIPLRGEAGTAYVSTERQLRAIMGTQTSVNTETAQRFVNAYRGVVGVAPAGKNVLICADIELNSNVDFVPIDGYAYNSSSTADYLKCGFDGGNCVITGMVINKPSTDYVGMFSQIDAEGVKLRNIILEDVRVTGKDYVGALVGEVTDTPGSGSSIAIINCRVTKTDGGTCTVTGKNYVGGLIGQATGLHINYSNVGSWHTEAKATSGSAADVTANATVVTTTENNQSTTNYYHPKSVGGMIGKMNGVTLTNCYATGDVTAHYGGSVNNNAVIRDLQTGTNAIHTDNAVGGFVGTVMNVEYSEISHSFALGNVLMDAKYAKLDHSSDDSRLGVGGFAGCSTIPLTDCFAAGDVSCVLGGYAEVLNPAHIVEHGVGGLVGLSLGSAASVTNAYSSSAVSLSCDQTSISDAVHIGVGGVVGLVSSTTASVEYVYSSGSVACPTTVDNTDDTDPSTDSLSCNHYFGAAVGFAAGTAEHAYYDTWTNTFWYGTGVTLKAVGNLLDDAENTAIASRVRSGFTTDQFCSGVLVTSGCLPADDPSTTNVVEGHWGYDSQPGVASNAYPYLVSYFGSDVSDYVKFPAVLSVVAVRPNDRDENGRSGKPLSMAVTAPATIHVVDTTYSLDSSAGASYGNTFAPIREGNDETTVSFTFWIKSYKPDNEDMLYEGFYDLSASGVSGAMQIVADGTGAGVVMYSAARRNAAPSYTPALGDYVQLSSETGKYTSCASDADGALLVVADYVPYSTVKQQAKDSFVPHIGQYVTLSSGYRAYGQRSIRRIFQVMLGTDRYPYLISTVEELRHIANYVNGTDIRNVTDPQYYDKWFSQQQKVLVGASYQYINVQKNTNTDENGMLSDADATNDGVVHFRLMINIDMASAGDQTASFLYSMKNGNTPFTFTNQQGNTITYQGFVLDGNDYAIVNFSSGKPFVDELDANCSITNLIFDNAQMVINSGSGDLALVKTNNGTIDGLMLTSGGSDRDYSTDIAVNSADSNVAGLVVTNNGTIKNSFFEGTLEGGGANKYVGGIAAINNGTIERCVSAAELEARTGTAGIGGLVGLNAASHTVTESFTLGSVKATASDAIWTGGFVGVNNGTVSYSYSRTEVEGKTGKAASFVGQNAGTISNAFAAGRMTIGAAGTAADGSAFAASSTGTLTNAYADKALLGSNTYKLLLDAEVTENIISLDCLDNSTNKFLAAGDTYTAYAAAQEGEDPEVLYSYTNPTANAYPQLRSVYELYKDNTSTYDLGGVTHSYTMMKAQLLKAYSVVSSVTVDTVAANYVDAMPQGTSNVVSSITDVDTYDANDELLSSGKFVPVTPAGPITSGSGSVTAKTKTNAVSQKTGAGDNTLSDLKYTPKYTFTYACSSAANPNPNFTSGKGTDAAATPTPGVPYGISSQLNLESLTYFGKATDAYFVLTGNVSLDGNALTQPIDKFYAHLDGAGYTINDLDISGRPGLFGKLEDGAEVKNLGLVGIQMSATPSTTMRNFGLLAGESGAATVENVYAVGELIVNNNVSVTTDVHVGGLIGYAKGTTIRGVVTSGVLKNLHEANGSAVGGIVGWMQGGSIGSTTSGEESAAESTAYVYGMKYVGGIVGETSDIPATASDPAASPTISNVIYAGACEGASGATRSHILANNGSATPNSVVTNARYDKQISSFAESAYTANQTFFLSKYEATAQDPNGFHRIDAEENKYYANPIALPSGVTESAAFRAGLYFALARITISLAGGPGDLNSYDAITASSPLTYTSGGSTIGNDSDRVYLSVDQNSSYVSITNDSGAGNRKSSLIPQGDGTSLSAGLSATYQNTISGATFYDNVNTIYRYLPITIGRLVNVSYIIVDDTTGHAFGNTEMGLAVQSSAASVPIAANAITNTDVDADDSNTVRYSQLFVPAGGDITVDAVLASQYGFSVASTSGTPVAGNHTITSSEITNNAVTIYVHVHAANATWGLQDRNSKVTVAQ